jgi:hypothetical protein
VVGLREALERTLSAFLEENPPPGRRPAAKRGKK